MEGEDRIGELLNDFYSSLFSSSNPTDFDAVLDCVEPRVTPEMNEFLTRPFVASEVQTALAQMKANNIGQKLERRFQTQLLVSLI